MIKNINFQLLGKADEANPSSIPLKIIQNWQDENLVVYLGVSQDVREQIANATCIVLPSYREGVPLSLLEAMAMEKPIIATNVAGCKEVVFDGIEKDGLLIGKNGILCQQKSSDSLTKAIEYFLNLTKNQRLEMGRAGREFAKKIFDVKNTIEIYQNKTAWVPKNKPLAFVSNTSFGMLHFRLEVLKALQKQGHCIHILAPQDSSVESLVQEGFFYHEISVDPKGLNPFLDIATLLQIKQILKTIQPCLTFSYTIKPAIYTSLACRFLKIPSIAIITGLGYVFLEGGLKKKILKSLVVKMYSYALKKIQEVWFLNPEDRTEFVSTKIIPEHKTFLLRSEGVNTDYFSPSFSSKTSQTPAPSNEQITFLLIARMLWDKGVGEFIQTSKNIKKREV